MFQYEAFGLGIHSSFPFPELIERDTTCDILIGLTQAGVVPPRARGKARWIEATENEVLIAWENVGTFTVREGREITITPVPGVAEELVRLCTLGVSLSLLLQQRALSVFHASAVSIEGQAVMFAGNKGMGKSTLAATLNARGHHLLSDDAVVLQNGDTPLTVVPGFPQLKLWPDVIESLFAADQGEFPRLEPGGHKRAVDTTKGFSLEPAPLRSVFLLSGGETPEIERLAPQKAMLRLMPHWYGAWLDRDLLKALGEGRHLLQCGKVVNSVPVFELRRQQSLETLPALAKLVEQFLANESGVWDT